MSAVTVVTRAPDDWAVPIDGASAATDICFLGRDRFLPGIGEMAHRQAYDVCEMPLATALQAIAAGQPLILLPVVALWRAPHPSLLRHPAMPASYDAVAGHRVAVRTFAQNGGVWTRAVLQQQFQVDLATTTWLTTDPELFDRPKLPAWVTRTNSGQDITGMVRSHIADFAVVGASASIDAGTAPVSGSPAADFRQWLRTGPLPLSHIMVTTESSIATHGDRIRELMDAVRKTAPETWAAGDALVGAALEPGMSFDRAHIQDVIEQFAAICARQGVLEQEPLAVPAQIDLDW